MTKPLYDGYHMPTGEYRRFGSLWIHMSERELIWSLAAALSLGIIIGLGIALAAVAVGGSL